MAVDSAWSAEGGQPVSILFALLGAFTNATTAVLQRLASVSRPKEVTRGWRIALYLVRQPLWLLGLAFMGATFVFTAVALYFGELAVVQPILVTELVFTLALRQFWLHDVIPARTWVSAVLICGGLAGFLLAAHPREGVRAPSPAEWVRAVVIRAVLVLFLLLLSRTGSPSRKAASLGAAAGLVWSVDAACVKAATDVLARDGLGHLFLHWPIYAVVVTGVLGTFLVEASLTAGPLAASQPALLIVDPLASILLGIELFNEQLNSSPMAITLSVTGLVVMSVGVVLISRWAPPVMSARRKVALQAGEGPPMGETGDAGVPDDGVTGVGT